MFKKLLIATRGESAARIARTAKHLEMQTVAVYGAADVGAVHREACDESVLLGDKPLGAAYADISRILEIAREVGADAVHPGYGPLSERGDVARAVREAGLTFIGPSEEHLELFADRLTTRGLAVQAGVRVPEGSLEAVDLTSARAQAEELGLPLVVKPVRASRRFSVFSEIEDLDDLEKVLSRAARTSEGSGGDARVFLERAFHRPRLVEVQVVADAQETVAIGERECSLQKAGRPIVDETPAPALSGSEKGFLTREAIWDAAVRVIQEAGYQGVAAVLFVVDEACEAHLVEVRPRLSLAHGTTEMCTGCDLVEAQLLIAAGEAMPAAVRCSMPSGHAIEVTILAEAAAGKRPVTGTVRDLRWPNASPTRVRIEASVDQGSELTEQHEPDLAKIITHAPTRHAAVLMMDRVLAEHSLSPIPSNAALLRRILNHESFRAGEYDAGFVDRLSKR